MNAPFSPAEAARAIRGRVVGKDRVRGPSPGMPPTDESLEIKFGSKYADGFTVNDYYGGNDDWQHLKDYVREACGRPFEPSQKDDPVQRMSARANAKPKWGPVVKTYEYTEADGTILFRVCRHDPKNFHQEMPDGNGGWTKSMEGMQGRHVLYLWPGIVEFPDATIFVVEGEKDADRLASLGHTATTITGSATWTEDCIAPLRGRHVIVMEDNDEKGRKRAGNAARSLHGQAASLRYVRFLDLPERGDVSDWLDANNNDIETLLDRCLATPEWEPTADQPEEDESAADEAAPALISATPYVWRSPETIPLRDWIYGYQLIRKFVSATVSPGGIGKSSLIATETLAMVSGKSLLDIQPKKQLRAWLWNLEDPQEETERKIQATAAHYQLTESDIGDRLFMDSGRDQRLVMATVVRGGTVIVEPVVEAITAEIIARQIDVIIIDPFVSCHEVPENDNGSMDRIVKEWGKVADKGNCAIHLVHHTPKMQGGEVTAESARGGKAFTDACRVVRAINRMSPEEGERAGVDNPRLYFRAINDKASLQPPADRSDWFKLTSVDLGNGPLGAPGDNVGVVTTWQWPDPLGGMTAADFDKVAAEIRAGRWRESVQAADWVGGAVAKALGLNISDKRDRAKVSGMLKAWLAAGSLIVVSRKDDKRNIRPYVEVREA